MTKRQEQAFEVGGIQFAAVRANFPRPHWRFRLEETGEVFQPGTSGISNESVPKMKADFEYLLERVFKGRVGEFRASFDLRPEVPAVRRFRVEVLYGEHADQGDYLDTWEGDAISPSQAERRAYDAIWDERLTVASCSPRFKVAEVSDEVATG